MLFTVPYIREIETLVFHYFLEWCTTFEVVTCTLFLLCHDWQLYLDCNFLLVFCIRWILFFLDFPERRTVMRDVVTSHVPFVFHHFTTLITAHLSTFAMHIQYVLKRKMVMVNECDMVVVYFDQLFGAACTWKLVKVLICIFRWFFTQNIKMS